MTQNNKQIKREIRKHYNNKQINKEPWKKNLISVLILCTIFGNTLGKQKTNSFFMFKWISVLLPYLPNLLRLNTHNLTSLLSDSTIDSISLILANKVLWDSSKLCRKLFSLSISSRNSLIRFWNLDFCEDNSSVAAQIVSYNQNYFILQIIVHVCN